MILLRTLHKDIARYNQVTDAVSVVDVATKWLILFTVLYLFRMTHKKNSAGNC